MGVAIIPEVYLRLPKRLWVTEGHFSLLCFSGLLHRHMYDLYMSLNELLGFPYEDVPLYIHHVRRGVYYNETAKTK